MGYIPFFLAMMISKRGATMDKINVEKGILWDNWFKRFKQKTKKSGKVYGKKQRKLNKVSTTNVEQ